jgi:mannose-1-phosphate guanylyltransferase
VENFVVVIAGGAGTRFWPAGRAARPKQLLPIASERTMLAETIDRSSPLAPPSNTFVITTRLQAEATRRECARLPRENVLPEPLMRNTAAAIALAAERIRRRSGDGVMIVMPADHVIRPLDRFLAIFRAAAARARLGESLLTIGIQPTGPATGYGYIEAGEEIARSEGEPVRKVISFKEKPDLQTAAGFLRTGRYFWNSGTFVWKVSAILRAIETHLPGHAALLRSIPDGPEIPEEVYARFENVPIDVGVMEKAQNVEVIPADFQWDDVGSWLAMARLNPKDADGNVVRGRHVGIETRHCVLVGDGHLLATIGVEDLIVVHTPDATLICPKSRAEEVKAIVARLQILGWNEYL